MPASRRSRSRGASRMPVISATSWPGTAGRLTKCWPHARDCAAHRSARAFRTLRPTLRREFLRAANPAISWTANAPAWHRSTPRRPSANGWDAWRGRGREFHARYRCGPRSGRRTLPPSPRGAAGTNINAVAGASHHSEPHGGHYTRSGGLPQLRPAVQSGPGAQPDAARDSGAGRGRGLRRGLLDRLHRLRGLSASASRSLPLDRAKTRKPMPRRCVCRR